MLFIIILSLIPYFFLPAGQERKEEISQWRGPDRNGIYPEKGLKKQWPKNGPEMLWSFDGIGEGYGSVGVSKEKIFVLGLQENTGFLYVFNYQGKLLWKKAYGPEWQENYPGTRSTPTITGEYVYFESGKGTVYCYNGNTGIKLWSVDLLKKFNSKNITWGMAESILIKGDKLFCTPGGKENNVVALNRFTGETLWTSKGNRQASAYCSPSFIKHNKTELIVTMTAESIIGIDAETGQIYWNVPHFQMNNIHANSPIYSNGRIYCTSDIPSGTVALKLSDDGKHVTTEWQNKNFNNLMGGIILTEGHIYGSLRWKNLFGCMNASNGQMVYTSNKVGVGNIIMADGMFYCYSERGELALVQANSESINIVSKFQIPLGSGPHWSHPVINHGTLYIRHGTSLMAFNISDKLISASF